MKNRFYVFTTNNYRLLMRVMLVVVIVFFIGTAVYFIVLEQFTAAVAIGVAAILTVGGALLSARLTVLGDYILLVEDGISYRHIGGEKLFIPYAEASAAIGPARTMGNQRYKTPLIIGVKGSFAADDDLILSATSWRDGWFFCAFDKNLVAALEAKLGPVAPLDAESSSADTGVHDGEGKRPAAPKERAARRRKCDDTHDDGPDDSGSDGGGWRCD